MYVCLYIEYIREKYLTTESKKERLLGDFGIINLACKS